MQKFPVSECPVCGLGTSQHGEWRQEEPHLLLALKTRRLDLVQLLGKRGSRHLVYLTVIANTRHRWMIRWANLHQLAKNGCRHRKISYRIPARPISPPPARRGVCSTVNSRSSYCDIHSTLSLYPGRPALRTACPSSDTKLPQYDGSFQQQLCRSIHFSRLAQWLSTSTMAFLILVIGDMHIPDRALDIPPKVSNHYYELLAIWNGALT